MWFCAQKYVIITWVYRRITLIIYIYKEKIHQAMLKKHFQTKSIFRIEFYQFFTLFNKSPNLLSHRLYYTPYSTNKNVASGFFY